MLSQKDIIRFSKHVDTEGDCYLWTGTVSGNGYGIFSIKGIIFSAHRVAYEFYHGPISSSTHILHTCNNRLCVREEHLYAGTEMENSKDRIRNGNHGTQKLSIEQVQIIKDILRHNLMSQKKIKKLFSISGQTISSIHTKVTWAYVEPAGYTEAELRKVIQELDRCLPAPTREALEQNLMAMEIGLP